MALEPLETLHNMSEQVALKRANETLEEYRNMRGTDQHTLLIDAQFYLGQVRDQQEHRYRMWERALEIVIIVMIGFEIYEGWEQSKILQQVSNNAAATASVLKDVEKTMAAMNGTIQAQNVEANRVLIDIRYSGDWMYLTNTGHPTVFVYAVRVGDQTVPPLAPTPSVSTGGRIQLPAPRVEETFREMLKTRKRYVMPVELDLTDGTGSQYVAKTGLVGTPLNVPGGGMSVTMNDLVITQLNWRK